MLLGESTAVLERYLSLESLDERGVREKALKYALKGKYGEFGSHDVGP